MLIVSFYSQSQQLVDTANLDQIVKQMMDALNEFDSSRCEAQEERPSPRDRPMPRPRLHHNPEQGSVKVTSNLPDQIPQAMRPKPTPRARKNSPALQTYPLAGTGAGE